MKVYNSSTELGAATVSGTSWSYSATVANGTTYQFNVRETDLAGNTSAATSNLAVTGDTTPPTVSGVAITSATGIQNNLLNAGDNVSVTVTFSENVPVTGTPQLTLAVGTTTGRRRMLQAPVMLRWFSHTRSRLEIMTPMASVSGPMPLP